MYIYMYIIIYIYIHMYRQLGSCFVRVCEPPGEDGKWLKLHQSELVKLGVQEAGHGRTLQTAS